MSNTKLSGYPTISEIDVFKSEKIALQSLGMLGVTADGRKFRYVKAGAAVLVPGDLLQSPAHDAAFTALAVAANVTVPLTSASITTTIFVTNGASPVVADEFKGGYMLVTAGAGIGQVFVVASHTAAAAGDPITVYTEDPVRVALASASSLVSFVKNPCDGVIQHPIVATGTPVGVAVYAIPAGEYGFVQTGGECPVLSDASPAAVGEVVEASVATAGAVTVYTGATLPALGVASELGVAARTGGVVLNLS